MDSFAPDFPQYFPSRELSDINIMWTYGIFFSIEDFNTSYYQGKLGDFDYSQQRYIDVFADVASIIYKKSVATNLWIMSLIGMIV